MLLLLCFRIHSSHSPDLSTNIRCYLVPIVLVFHYLFSASLFTAAITSSALLLAKSSLRSSPNAYLADKVEKGVSRV